MANIKVSEMTEATTFDEDDYTMIVQANQNKKITKTNMFDDINNNIGDLTTLETEDKTSIVNSINELKNAEIHSTNEIKTTKIWIDGKPIYRKCYEITPSSGGGTYPTDIINLDKITNFESLPVFSGGTYSDGFYNNPTDYARIYLSPDGTQFNPRSAGSSLPLWRITLEYTKTTDQGNENIGE